MFRKEFNEYSITKEEIMEQYNLDEELYNEMMPPYYYERAKLLIEKLEELDERLPDVIKEAIWKLQIIAFTARRIADPTSLSDLVKVEDIENYAIKVQMNDFSKFREVSACGALSVEVLDDTRLEVLSVVAIELADLKTLSDMAKRLKDKVLIRELVTVYVDKDRFFMQCSELDLDPRDENEIEVNLMWEVAND